MLEFIGTAEQRGYEHGRTLELQIKQRILGTLAVTTPSETARKHLSRPWADAIEENVPGLIEEIHGIARGAGVGLHDVVLLNAFEAFDISTQVELGGCTSIAASRSNGALVGQNWDANDSLAESLDVHLHRGPDTLTTIVLASPGGVGWIGMNEAGLAVCNNDLLTEQTQVSTPSQAVRRRMLQETTVEGAIAALTATAAPGGRAYTIGDANGQIATIEIAAENGTPEITRPETKTAHSNHALAASIQRWEDPETLLRIYPSSQLRQDRAVELLQQDILRPEDLRTLLEDHTNYPFSICRHHTEEEPTATAATAIFDCATKEARFSLGNPCTGGPVTTIRLSSAPLRKPATR